ncbi:hypothetical protein X729_32120 [Mesorhizobium sp. L103C131B0]|nr:hypothetical protein X729_32120 [Mesorhizobium sp. L103C131B0]
MRRGTDGLRVRSGKNREGFRPIAPICLEQDVALHFDLARPSPYMLLFQNVIDSRLQAVTHVDGTARAQTVSQQENPRLFQLLTSFKAKSGVGVLCNTSLNFNGTGFINRASDLLAYARTAGLDGFVINDKALLTNMFCRSRFVEFQSWNDRSSALAGTRRASNSWVNSLMLATDKRPVTRLLQRRGPDTKALSSLLDDRAHLLRGSRPPCELQEGPRTN